MGRIYNLLAFQCLWVMTDKNEDEHNEFAYPPTAALKRTSPEVPFGG